MVTLELPTVSFATNCWEKDWRFILSDPAYLREKQIENHRFRFTEKILVINNVDCLSDVVEAGRKKIDEGVLTRLVIEEEIAPELLQFFQLKRGRDFTPRYRDADEDYIYHNTLGPLAAIYSCRSDYLLFLRGDVRLDQPVSWIEQALQLMQKNSLYKNATLCWDGKYSEARCELPCPEEGGQDFYCCRGSLSDQLFLVKTTDFRAPIYHNIRPILFPKGDIFEKRATSAMLDRGWLRLNCVKGTYIHQNF